MRCALSGGESGNVATRGALTVRVLPFVPQPDYDKLLWACDLNFVRGEDSFVRAQWAGKPFIWHIYPQDENLHHKKLRAFLQRYAAALPGLAGLRCAGTARRMAKPATGPPAGPRWQRKPAPPRPRRGMAAANAVARRPGQQSAGVCRHAEIGA
jgi:uncharacterized repeat protein (TIGR03837 family)